MPSCDRKQQTKSEVSKATSLHAFDLDDVGYLVKSFEELSL